MQKELLALFGCVTFAPSATRKTVDPSFPVIFNREVAALGYGFDADLLQRLGALSGAAFGEVRRDLLALLVEQSGVSYTHQTLFAHFPHRTPNQDSYLNKRILGYLQNLEGVDMTDDVTALSCGHLIDQRLFKLEDFGACPICQRQVPELKWTPQRPNQPLVALTPVKLIGFADDARLTAIGDALLARPSSLAEAEKTVLRALLGRKLPLTVPESLYRETLPFAFALVGAEAIKDRLVGATDVLRCAVFVSNDAPDLSLATPPRFKLGRHHVHDCLVLLDHLAQRGQAAFVEDLMRHREPWKRFARHVHIGQARLRRRFPLVTTLFDHLIKDEATVPTFNRVVEAKVRAGTIDADLLATLESRPGEFMRRLDVVLRRAISGIPHTPAQTALGAALARRQIAAARSQPTQTPVEAAEPVLAALDRALPRVRTDLLFATRKYLLARGDTTGQRAFFPKGQVNRVQVVADTRPAIPDAVLLDAVARIDGALHERLAQRAPLGRVYVDPRLKDVVMPYNRRGDSATTTAVRKGSRYPIAADAAVLRLFVHWTGNIDVDLSLLVLDSAFGVQQQISYTNLHGIGCVHSGDIQRAPQGASEFIDVDLATIGRARYLAMSVISFTGNTFDTFPAFAGFMERDSLRSGAVYEPESVALKFDLTGKTRSYLPLLFDVVTRQVIWMDLATGGGGFQSVQHQNAKFMTLAQMAIDLPRSKTTAWDVLEAHVAARGTRVDTPEDADQVFMAESLDLNTVVALMAD